MILRLALGLLGGLTAAGHTLAQGPSLQGTPAPAVAARSATVADTARANRMARADLGRIRGSEKAPVWLIVMSDFECPFCKTWHDETAPLIERNYVATGKVRVAYMNYIAVSSHRNAPPAHEAAMCAAEQGRFWQMADTLFATQRKWKSLVDPGPTFDAFAAAHKLDLPRFRACVREGAVRPLIAADQDRVRRLGMGGTPAFLVGEEKVMIGAQPYAAFKIALDEALAKAANKRP